MRHPKFLLSLILLLAIGISHAYNFGQNKVNLLPDDWSIIQTLHFDIYFPAGEDVFGKTVALMAEETYYMLREELTYPVNSRIPLIFYGNRSQFQNTNIIYPLLTEGVGGFTESLRNRVVMPFDGSYTDLEELLVHELTHAYINALDSGMIGALSPLRPVSFPHWFSEGMPEYLSIGGEDYYNNMFVLDMVVNDKLPGLDNVGGYYSYRLGESFLTFIANTFGRDKVSEFYYSLRASNDLNATTQKIFGLKFNDLESRWRYQLKRDYFPLVSTHQIPMESMEQRTKSEDDGSYLNLMPRFSPDGNQYAYFSTAGARYSIWLAGLHGLSKPERIFTGERNGQVEEFYYFRSNLSWFPDNRRLAFAAKTSEGDRIHILDTQRRKIVQSYAPEGIVGLYELDVSPSGNSIVFAGQRGMQCDLFLLDLETGALRQLTDDLFNDKQPRFAPNGNSIVFASERWRDPESMRRGFFANLVSEIYSLELASGQLSQLTFDPADCNHPFYDPNGQNVLYITAEQGVSNLYALDLSNSTRAQVTQVLSGVYSADLSSSGRHLSIANYFSGAWNIYVTPYPLAAPVYSAYQPRSVVASDDSLMKGIDLGQLDYFGKRAIRIPRRVNPAASYDSRRPLFGDPPPFSYTSEDSLLLMKDFSYDDRPTEISNPPEVKPYRTRFSLDSLWGGLSYSPTVGTIGYVELSLSDVMGNHGIGINAGISGKLEDSNLLLTYLYLKRRMDYGVGAYNLFNEYFIREILPGDDNYYRFRERQTGLYFLMRYPFSRFLRVEFDHMLYQRGRYLADWVWDNQTSGHWAPEQDIGQDVVYTPGLTVVHDNSLFGSTGPLLGWRAMYGISATFADGSLDYLTNYLDWRSYSLFSKRYAFAFRGLAGVSVGRNPQYFGLVGYNGVRGCDGDLSGTKKALVSAELRFPFFDMIKMAFPVPLNIPNVRGTIFADLGTVFTDFSQFRAVEDGKLKDLYMGFGFGPRLDLGYVVLRFDVAWLTDLYNSSKPTFYLSLSEDF